MVGAAGITKDSVEAQTSVTDSVKGILSIMRAHLHHISGIQTNKEVPPIRAKVVASKTQDVGLAILDRFLGKGIDYCKIVYWGMRPLSTCP